MGGISLPLASAAALAGVGTVKSFVSRTSFPGLQASVFRPQQWSQPALTMITIPPAYVYYGTQSEVPAADANAAAAEGMYIIGGRGAATNVQQQPKYLVFDAVMRLNHSRRARPTRNPIQVGANLTNHILLDPPTLDLDVLMTDVLPPYADGQWVGNPSKSISCFQVLNALQEQRVPLTVTTRLKTYSNMIIADIPAEDTVRSRFGLRCRVIFEGIFVADVATSTNSARPQTTGSTEQGTTQTQSVTAGVNSQNGLPSASTGVASSSALQAQYGSVIGAGSWSSNNTSQLAGSL